MTASETAFHLVFKTRIVNLGLFGSCSDPAGYTAAFLEGAGGWRRRKSGVCSNRGEGCKRKKRWVLPTEI